MAQERGNVMDEDETPPENSDVFTDPSELAGAETELPTSEEVPPEQVQERLEAPTGFHWTTDGLGADVLVETAPATQPGVQMTWTEPDPEVLKRASDGPVTEGQAVTSTGGTP